MTDHEYRTLNAYANSDLIELGNIKLNIQDNAINPIAARFGTSFHTLLLETQKPIDWSFHTPIEHAKILAMRDSFNSVWNQFYREYPIAAQQTEVVKTWTDPETGLPCKAKIDLKADNPGPGRTPTLFDPTITPFLVDLKTTSAKDANEFYDLFVKYGYDRQAAYYLDAYGLGYGFTFVGIKKAKPHDVFIIDMSVSTERRAMIDYGRKKNAFWLRKAAIEAQNPNGWRPSAWSRKPELTTI